MELRTAEILFKDQFAGMLEETRSGGTRFVYGAEWHTAIACCLPSTRREHEWGQGLHPFFQHLGPEGWLRERQARIAHIAEEDDLGLLLRYGADCIGAVSVRPQGELAPLAAAEATVTPGRTVSGIQRKLLVVKEPGGEFRAAGPTGPAPYIAKFNSADIPTLVRNEVLSLRWLAAVLGRDEVTAFQLGHVADLDELALVVTRFDRTEKGEKLRLEDFAQILCKPRGFDYAGKYEGSYEEVAAIVREHSARPAIDLARLYRRLIAFLLLGNADAHLKNFSLLETPAGLRLSPAYDVLNTSLYERFDQTLALSLGGERLQLERLSRQALEAYGERIGLPARVIERTFADLRRQAKRAATLVEPPAGEGPDGFVTRYSEIVSNSCLRLLEE